MKRQEADGGRLLKNQTLDNPGISRSFFFQGTFFSNFIYNKFKNINYLLIFKGRGYNLAAIILIDRSRTHFTAAIVEGEELFELDDMSPYCVKTLAEFTPELFVFACGRA
jgi:hypothetical protein